MKTNLILAIFGGLMFSALLGLWLERESHVCPEPEVKLMSKMDLQRRLVEMGHDIKVDGVIGVESDKAWEEAIKSTCAAKYFPKEKP